MHGEKLEGVWHNRTKEWAARRRGQSYGTYDFATRYLVGFAPLPAFRDLAPLEYQDKVAELVREIEDEGAAARGDNSVAGVEKILRQDPYEPPTRRPKRSPKPQFHAESREVREDLWKERVVFLSRYWGASDALRNRRILAAAKWFPEGSYPPALPLKGPPAPPRPPSPPTRQLTVEGAEVVDRGEIPAVEIPVRCWTGAEPERRARGQPP